MNKDQFAYLNMENNSLREEVAEMKRKANIIADGSITWKHEADAWKQKAEALAEALRDLAQCDLCDSNASHVNHGCDGGCCIIAKAALAAFREGK